MVTLVLLDRPTFCLGCKREWLFPSQGSYISTLDSFSLISLYVPWFQDGPCIRNQMLEWETLWKLEPEEMRHNSRIGKANTVEFSAVLVRPCSARAYLDNSTTFLFFSMFPFLFFQCSFMAPCSLLYRLLNIYLHSDHKYTNGEMFSHWRTRYLSYMRSKVSRQKNSEKAAQLASQNAMFCPFFQIVPKCGTNAQVGKKWYLEMES